MALRAGVDILLNQDSAWFRLAHPLVGGLFYSEGLDFEADNRACAIASLLDLEIIQAPLWSGGSRSKWTGSNVRDLSLSVCMFSIGSTGCFTSLETQREKDGSNTLYSWDAYPCTGSTSYFFILPLLPIHELREPQVSEMLQI